MIPMQHSLTQGPITKNILLFALPLGVTGIGYYLKKRA